MEIGKVIFMLLFGAVIGALYLLKFLGEGLLLLIELIEKEKTENEEGNSGNN